MKTTTTTSSSKKVYRASSLLNVGTIEDVVADAVQDNNDEKLFEGFGKGVVRDYKMRLPFYKSDIKDGLNIQCLAATMSLFFACLAPAIGFGSLFGVATGNAIGSVEMITSTAVCGIIYAMTSAQPMTIIGKRNIVEEFAILLFFWLVSVLKCQSFSIKCNNTLSSTHKLQSIQFIYSHYTYATFSSFRIDGSSSCICCYVV